MRCLEPSFVTFYINSDQTPGAGISVHKLATKNYEPEPTKRRELTLRTGVEEGRVEVRSRATSASCRHYPSVLASGPDRFPLKYPALTKTAPNLCNARCVRKG